MTQPLTLIQVTDTHLLEDPEALLRGHNPWYNLQAVLRQVALHQLDGLLLTGDLADQGSPAAYGYLREAIRGFDCPIYWLPGNHDNLIHLQEVLQLPRCFGPQAIDLGPWRLLMLNSVMAEAKFGEGYLAVEQLQWLQAELARYPDRPTAIALHHHPVPIGIDWMDQIAVQNADDLLSLLDGSPQVRLVLFGHIHQDLHHRWTNSRGGTLDFFGCPSTCVQVAPTVPTADQHLPGFRLVQLFADGQYQTRVHRVQPALVTL